MIVNMDDTIRRFDQQIARLKQTFEGVAIGGAALNLMGVVSRLTKDCDILDPKLPDWLLKEAAKFAEGERAKGVVLGDDWLNNGPESLKRTLPKHWENRLVDLFNGKALKLKTLGREDLLKTKLFAFCDRDVDVNDCIALRPSEHELAASFQWVSEQDANPMWAKHVEQKFTELKGRLNYGTRS